ncbi:SDR family oxidoreductase [Nocardia neocaledoniensis]|uniref:SDR family oxidoreductase n=1 Tax=Nocardia neocaledoniensis TaxID=236511 RepID=UPI0024575786|nr:sugar nucleotide-binding protein [Nocardia neocaledoniensis]
MRILILGASGFVGSALFAQLARDHEVVGTSRRGHGLVPLDPADADAVRALVGDRFDLVVHTAGLVDLAAAQRDPDAAYAANVAPMPALLDAVDDAGAKLVYLSTDNVFDGTREFYDETALRTPINVYGCTKAAAEQRVLRRDGHLVIRLPLMYGRSPASDKFLARFTAPVIEARTDIVGTPLYLPALAPLLTDLRDETGVIHLAGPEPISRYDLMVRVRDRLGAATRIVPTDIDSAPPDCPRPRRLILCSVRHAHTGPDVDAALTDLIGPARTPAAR